MLKKGNLPKASAYRVTPKLQISPYQLSDYPYRVSGGVKSSDFVAGPPDS